MIGFFVPIQKSLQGKCTIDKTVKLMKTLKLLCVMILMTSIPLAANAQFLMFGGGSPEKQDSLRRIAAADYADNLAKVGVGQPREGRQPNNPDERKHPNYD